MKISAIHLVALVAILLTSGGCLKRSSSDTPEVTGNPVPAPVEVNFSEMKMEDELWVHNGEPFTGVVVNYDGETLRTRWQMKDGKMHGLIQEWYPSGSKSAETNFVDGKRHGENRYWYENGDLQKLQIYDHGTSLSEETY